MFPVEERIYEIMESKILFTALQVFAFGLFSRLSETSPITAPIVFISIGLVTGKLGLNWFAFDMDLKLLEVIAEIKLPPAKPEVYWVTPSKGSYCGQAACHIKLNCSKHCSWLSC